MNILSSKNIVSMVIDRMIAIIDGPETSLDYHSLPMAACHHETTHVCRFTGELVCEECCRACNLLNKEVSGFSCQFYDLDDTGK